MGSFEWSVVLCGTAVVTTIVAGYGIGWERTAGESFVPVRAQVKPATARVVRAPVRAVAPPARTPVVQPAYVLTAARGDSWLHVRAGSAAGRLVWEGNLLRGQTVRLRSPRLWIRFGAAAHLDLLIDGRRARLPAFGTFDAFVGPRGVRQDRTPHLTIYATAAQSP